MIGDDVKAAFGLRGDIHAQRLSTGLINQTYKITDPFGKNCLLQKLNNTVFPNPLALQNNYINIQTHLAKKNSFFLPEIIYTADKKSIYQTADATWRCFEFINDTYSPSISSNADEAWQVANCFGKFSAGLYDIDIKKIETVLPGFHDLKLRFDQFLQSVKNASEERTKNAKHLIEQVFEYRHLVDFYIDISNDKNLFPLHILHHDCKIANILFKKDTGEVYSPVDLDTTQPGLYFSDLGDMIRSMAPNISENETDINNMELRQDFYEAVKDGYLSSMQNFLTREELKMIDMSGKIVIYMQALRFLADYLNNDIYYRTDYPEQNKNRTANQLKLLHLLNDYTKHKVEN